MVVILSNRTKKIEKHINYYSVFDRPSLCLSVLMKMNSKKRKMIMGFLGIIDISSVLLLLLLNVSKALSFQSFYFNLSMLIC